MCCCPFLPFVCALETFFLLGFLWMKLDHWLIGLKFCAVCCCCFFSCVFAFGILLIMNFLLSMLFENVCVHHFASDLFSSSFDFLGQFTIWMCNVNFYASHFNLIHWWCDVEIEVLTVNIHRMSWITFHIKRIRPQSADVVQKILHKKKQRENSSVLFWRAQSINSQVSLIDSLWPGAIIFVPSSCVRSRSFEWDVMMQ